MIFDYLPSFVKSANFLNCVSAFGALYDSRCFIHILYLLPALVRYVLLLSVAGVGTGGGYYPDL